MAEGRHEPDLLGGPRLVRPLLSTRTATRTRRGPSTADHRRRRQTVRRRGPAAGALLPPAGDAGEAGSEGNRRLHHQDGEGLDSRLSRIPQDAGRLRPALPAGQGRFPGDAGERQAHPRRQGRLPAGTPARCCARWRQSENDFTDRARQLKIEVIYKQQGGFTEKVESLKNFEDCYVRAQFEQQEMAKDEKTIKDAADAQREEETQGTPGHHHGRPPAAAQARGRQPRPRRGGAGAGQRQGDAGVPVPQRQEIPRGHRHRRAVRPSDPRSAQAADCAVYALQCYAEMVSDDEAAGRTPEELQPDRDKLFALTDFMEKTWPKETPGDMARFQLALLFINAKDPDNRDENVQKAIEALGRDHARLRPVRGDAVPARPVRLRGRQGQAQADPRRRPPDGYRKRALEALAQNPGAGRRRRSDDEQGLFPRQGPPGAGGLHAQEVRRDGAADDDAAAEAADRAARRRQGQRRQAARRSWARASRTSASTPAGPRPTPRPRRTTPTR